MGGDEAAADEVLDPRAARLLDMLRAGDMADAPSPSPQDRRSSLRALADLAADPPPVDVRCTTLTFTARDGESLAMRRYEPAGDRREAAPAMLYLHGGGWVAGDLDTHAGVCGTLAAGSGCHVFALDYRRPPEHPFPGPIRDAVDALAWLRRAAGTLGIDAERLVLGGDSAGANLAAAALQDLEAGAMALQLLICPILDLPRRTGSRSRFGHGFFLSAERLAVDVQDYLQGVHDTHPHASPLLAKDFSTRPRTLIHAAACDPFRDEALDYGARLRAAGVSARTTLHRGMIHYFYALPRTIPYARVALAAMGAEVEAALSML